MIFNLLFNFVLSAGCTFFIKLVFFSIHNNSSFRFVF